jgi:DNA polymerase III gamma/tau subunit
VFGQEFTVSYLKAVINRFDNAPHYFLLAGGWGCGKTTLCRAFAQDLCGSTDAPYYIEIDSAEKEIQDNFDVLKSLIFQEVGGRKVVVLDESHNLSSSCQQKLLKVLEDYYGDIVIFFATTDPQLMTDTIRSRVHRLSLNLFTTEECIAYGRVICEKEGLSFSDKTLGIMAVQAQGHLRDMVKGGIEAAAFMGEEAYLERYNKLLDSIEKYFTDFASEGLVEGLFSYHPVELKAFMMMFFREEILNPKGRYHKAPYSEAVQGKLFAQWLRLYGLIKDPNDFFSMLYVFRNILVSLLKGGQK